VNSAQQVFSEMMRLPEQESSISGPFQSKIAKAVRKLFYGVPKGRRFYFYMNRPMLRDAVVVVDAPMSHSYREVQDWINNLYKDYVVRLQPNKWEYIWHSDDYTFQRYGCYTCLESTRNENKKIRLDNYYKIRGTYQGKPSIFGVKKVGEKKNPLGLIEGQTRFRIGEKQYRVNKLLDGSTTVEAELLNPQTGDSVMHKIPMEKFIKRSNIQ
jgi:hypothetical protein